ncbi:MAG TPA: ABC transporter ATP-binding protein [Anaerolineales bacterium]|nr:ABC transporter ATP-binding protein [Anaerolineales bacterium]
MTEQARDPSSPRPQNNSVLLDVSDLQTYFFTDDGVVKAVDGVTYHVHKGEVFGLVGESGCGKSVSALSILRLVDPPGRIIGGKVRFGEFQIDQMNEAQMTDLRGSKISMIFQQPQSSLNPVFSVGDQISEVLRLHLGLKREDAWARAADLLQQVGIPDAESRLRTYPYELSGGQAQRVMIAMGLACSPELLIADEPTTALDVTIQAQILDLMRELRARLGTAIILITHDLGVVAEMADRVAVMYAGQIVEQADVVSLFDQPMHPYTQGLIASIPVLGDVRERLEVIPGSVPNLIDLPPGCRFAPRCRARLDHALTICEEQDPELIEPIENHSVRCWLYQSAAGHRAPLEPLGATP